MHCLGQDIVDNGLSLFAHLVHTEGFLPLLCSQMTFLHQLILQVIGISHSRYIQPQLKSTKEYIE